MIYIFHGDDQLKSRAAFNSQLDLFKDAEILRLDAKSLDFNQVNLYLNSPSLLNLTKVLAVTNFFSLTKSVLDKIVKLFSANPNFELVIWQDKKLTLTQLKAFPKAKVDSFNLNRQLFVCLNSIRPGNLNNFIGLYNRVLQTEPFELFLYLLKGQIRKNLQTWSRFSLPALKQTYLHLIELDFQSKTGQLTTPKEIALERILISLFKSV